MKKKEKINYTVPILFLLYLALLIWIILFKLQFSILDLDRVREINLIPFYYEHEVTFHATEVLQNVLIFMPFGIYLCLLLPKSRFGVKLLLISVVSLLLEICQYVLAIGRSDITDLIDFTCRYALTDHHLYRIGQFRMAFHDFTIFWYWPAK